MNVYSLRSKPFSSEVKSCRVERMKAAHPSAMRGMTAYSLSRILPQLGERVHTSKGNVYRVVAIK